MSERDGWEADLPGELTIAVYPPGRVNRNWESNRNLTYQAGLQAYRGTRELYGETKAHIGHGCHHYGRRAVNS